MPFTRTGAKSSSYDDNGPAATDQASPRPTDETTEPARPRSSRNVIPGSFTDPENTLSARSAAALTPRPAPGDDQAEWTTVRRSRSESPPSVVPSRRQTFESRLPRLAGENKFGVLANAPGEPTRRRRSRRKQPNEASSEEDDRSRASDGGGRAGIPSARPPGRDPPPHVSRVVPVNDDATLPHREVSIESEPVASGSKGKGSDPRNWGNAGLSTSDVDPAAQAAAFEHYRRQRRQARFADTAPNIIPSREQAAGESSVDPNDVHEVNISTLQEENATLRSVLREARKVIRAQQGSSSSSPAPKTEPDAPLEHNLESASARYQYPTNFVGLPNLTYPTRPPAVSIRPTQQVPVYSQLGRALGLHHAGHDEPDPSQSSSNETEDAGRRRGRRRHTSRLKPVPPESYNGDAQYNTFLRFISSSREYLEDGAVPASRQTRVISRFLTGRAYTFYLHNTALRDDDWPLDTFVQALYDFVFPIDEVTRLRKRFDRLRLGDRTVREFSDEILATASMIGLLPADQRLVQRLWDGVPSEWRLDLFKEGLSPEGSEWAAVLGTAERLERAHRAVSGDRHRQSTQPSARNSMTVHAASFGNPGGQRGRNQQNSQPSNSRPNAPSGPRDGRATTAPQFPPASQPRNAFRGRPGNQRRGPGGQNSRRDTYRQPHTSYHRSGGPPGGTGGPFQSQLSNEERDRLTSSGACFHCKRVGHLSRNCPDRAQVPSGGSGPPGTSSYSMGVNFSEVDTLESMTASAEHFDDLPVHAMHLPLGVEDVETDEETVGGSEVSTTDGQDVDVQYAPEPMGPALADRVQLLLLANQRLFRYNHPVYGFPTYQAGTDDYWIGDPVRPAIVRLPIHLLLRPQFNIVLFYAARVVPHCDHCGSLSHSDMQVDVPGVDGCHCARDWADWLDLLLLDNFPRTSGDSDESLADRLDDDDSDDGHEQGSDEDFEDMPEMQSVTDDGEDYQDAWSNAGEDSGEPSEAILPTASPTSDPLPTSSSLPLDAPDLDDPDYSYPDTLDHLAIFAAKTKQVPEGNFAALQCNSARTKDFARKIPRPIVITVRICGHPVRALLDSGSLGDFMSSAVADQLKVPRIELEKPLPVQLAVQGSRTKVNFGTRVPFEYARINCERYFDIVNIEGYDLILGTPFLFQHSAVLGFNDTRLLIGSDKPLPITGDAVATLSSRAMDVLEVNFEKVREDLRAYAAPLCRKAVETTLPPLRRINHRIPIIDEERVYSFRPSRCPEAFRGLWSDKRDQYIKSGRWRFATGTNAAPLMFLKKHGAAGAPLRMRNTIDLRERNANTRKLASPLPDQRAVLFRVASHRYVSSMDGQDAYEQIRVEPEDVKHTLMNTPDGTVESLVMQQGDCNAVATFMTIMNSLFAAYLGVWMDIYLDDIVIYSNSLEDHIKHVKIVIDILGREQFYLAESKLHFLPQQLKLLGHIITRDGIKMDPEKVDSVAAWKTPTNRDLLRGFIGSVGYLADNVEGVRIPLDVLNRLTGDTVAFCWGPTEQRAFELVKTLVQDHRDSHRVPMKYGPDADPVHLVTDGCISGVAGKLSQGPDWKTAPIIAFYSAKLSPAQQNYAVHEIELLAGLETMMRFRDLLLGVQFTWYTDHRGLEHFLNQRNLTGRQARWTVKLSDFDFTIKYVPGVENTVSDALSRLYSNDAPGTVRTTAEYVQHDNTSPSVRLFGVSTPIKVDGEARATMRRSERLGAKTEAAPTTAPRAPQPETSKVFAKRVRKLVLHGPKTEQRAEGEGTLATPFPPSSEQPNAPSNPTTSSEEGPTKKELDQALLPLLTKLTAPVDLLTSVPTKGIAFPDCLRGRYAEDPFFKIVLESPRQFKNFTIRNELVFLTLAGGREVLCIPDCLIDGRSAREIIISHAHSLLAHLDGREAGHPVLLVRSHALS